MANSDTPSKMRVRKAPACIPRDLRSAVLQTIYHELAEVQEDVFQREEYIKRQRKSLAIATKAQTIVPVAANIRKAHDMRAHAESGLANDEEGLRLLRTKLEQGQELEELIKAIPEC